MFITLMKVREQHFRGKKRKSDIEEMSHRTF